MKRKISIPIFVIYMYILFMERSKIQYVTLQNILHLPIDKIISQLLCDLLFVYVHTQCLLIPQIHVYKPILKLFCSMCAVSPSALMSGNISIEDLVEKLAVCIRIYNRTIVKGLYDYVQILLFNCFVPGRFLQHVESIGIG